MPAVKFWNSPMSAACCGSNARPAAQATLRYRRILWIALVVNLAMFGVEIGAGWKSGSVSLLADAVDFFGDAANYGVSLFVLSMALSVRAKAALLKGVTMAAYGFYVLGQSLWNALNGVMPEASTMGAIGMLALAANLSVAVLLYAYREGDANMRSVWLCSRNDAIGNLAIVLAAAGVFGTGSAWPDLAVATVMGLLGLIAARQVIAQASNELRPVATLQVTSGPAIATNQR